MLFRYFLLAPCFLASGAHGFKWFWQDDTTTTTSTTASASSTLSSVTNTTSASSTTSSESYTGDGTAYAPRSTTCPDTDILREASDISDQEKAFVSQRQVETNKNLITYLDKVAKLSKFDAEEFVNGASKNISIALAFSGGGYRAMLSGAGQLLALDNRYDDAVDSGLGGILQSSTYIAGLSGGSWMVGTLVLNNWMSVIDIVNNKDDLDLWDLDNSIFNPSGINLLGTISYYNEMRKAVSAKGDAGFDTSITDVWGRALSYQFLNEDEFPNGGENITWSSVAELSSFTEHTMPFPIFVANGRAPGTTIVNLNSTVFEMTPYELGSWDPSLKSFVDIKYLGTELNDGEPNGTCVTNYDNAGFLMGTSSSLFNQMILSVQTSDSLNWALQQVLNLILSPFSKSETDIAVYNPNPFYNSSYATQKSISTNDTLYLVDGGEDNQNVPLYPFVQKTRDVDVLFAFDNSADTSLNWPNGSSLVYSFKRQFTAQGYGTPFPYVPDVSTFVEEGLNKRPVFFGCDAQNLTELIEFHHTDINETDIPLVVYMPYSYYSYEANVSTYKMSYDNDESRSVIRNGFESSTRGNGTDDKNWHKCVACAIIRREQERAGTEQSDECKECFADYCWQGGATDSAEGTVLSQIDIFGSSSSSSSSSSSGSSSSSRGSSASTLSSTRSSSTESHSGTLSSTGGSSTTSGTVKNSESTTTSSTRSDNMGTRLGFSLLGLLYPALSVFLF